MAGTSKNPSSNSGKSNGAPGAALVYVKCGHMVCQFAHASGVTPPQPHVSHLKTHAVSTRPFPSRRGGLGSRLAYHAHPARSSVDFML